MSYAHDQAPGDCIRRRSALSFCLALVLPLLAGCDLFAYDMLGRAGGADAGAATDGGDVPTTGPCAFNGPCPPQATCRVSGDAPVCECRPGYEGNGTTCTDIDECARGTAGCHALATCANEVGGVRCTCAAGYTGDGKACVDVDECSSNNGGCPAGSTCVNSEGSRKCECAGGYQEVEGSCRDVNECDVDNGGCHANADCTNTPGSRTCACKAGYDGNGLQCESCGACTLRTWTSTTSVSAQRQYPDAFALGDRVFVIGGTDHASTAQKDLLVSTIAADGTLGTWSTSSKPMQFARKSPCVARHGDRLYVAGSASSAAVEFISVANNSLGSWTTTTSVPGMRLGGHCAVVNGALYVFGGMNVGSGASTPPATWRGVIAGDGTIATWETLQAEGVVRYDAASFVFGKWLYLLGGQGLPPGTTHASVSRGEVQPDGSVVWTEARALPSTLFQIDAVLVGNRVYVVDGQANGGSPGRVLTTTVDANGELAPWDIDTPHGVPGWPNLVNAGTRMYLVSGSANVSFTSFR